MNSADLSAAINAAGSQTGTTGPASTATSPSTSSNEMTNVTVYVQDQQTNPLNDYDSYTYCLSLHLLSIDEYNDLMTGTEILGQKKLYYPQNVLVSSAGRYGRDFVRNRHFTEDFYFDNFKMSTVINTTTRNRSTNLVECSFTLIEPLGFTFINRLIAAANELNTGGSYLLMPFVIQIDFFGFKDGDIMPSGTGNKFIRVGEGNNFVNPGPLDSMTKVIPIKLTDLKSRITTRGTEYSIQAVPYNHHAFNQIYVTSPAAFTIAAKTVQEVFGSGTADQNATTIANQRIELEQERQRLAAATASPGNDGRGGFGIANSQSQLAAIDKQLAALSTNLQSTGYTDGINGWSKGLLAKGSVQTIDTISVVFDDEIANATLYPTTGPINTAQATSNDNAKTVAQNAAGQAKGQIDFRSGKISIPAGMTIDKLIDWAVRNSSYIGNQLSDPSTGKTFDINADRSKPLNWYKIVPRILIKSFDPLTNRYSLAITYYVKMWTLSAKHPYAPQGRAPGFVKEYAWFYTGQNKDVLDMQIDFDLLYFNELQAFRNKTKLTDTAKNVGDPNLRQAGDDNPDSAQAVDAGSTGVPRYRQVSPVATSYVSSRYMQGRAGADQSDSATAADVQRSFTLSARGDMVNLKLRIIGDPHFIKQDDLFYMGRGSGKDTNLLTDNNSLWMDNGELYIRVLFDTPADYDETIGLAIPGNNPYSKNEFSGIYKLITVSNDFARGKFEQTLDLVLITIEEASNSTRDNAIQRIESLILQNYTPKGFTATRFSGPNVIQNTLIGGGAGVGASLTAGSSGGGGGGLLSGLTGQLQQVAGNAVNKAISDVTKPLVDKAGAYAKDAFNKIKDSLGFGSTSTLGGGGGADGAASSSSGNIPDQHAPEQSAMNQASEEWNNESTDPNGDAFGGGEDIEFNDGVGVDGAVDVDVADLDLGGDFGGDFGGDLIG